MSPARLGSGSSVGAMPHRHIGSGVGGIWDGGVVELAATDLAEDDARQEAASLNLRPVRATRGEIVRETLKRPWSTGSDSFSRSRRLRRLGRRRDPQPAVVTGRFARDSRSLSPGG